MSRRFALLQSLLASSLRHWRGTAAFHPATRRPLRLLELYDIENCPFCRVVREALTELDLDAVIYPCPRGGKRFRPLAEQLGGKQLFPMLHDPNTGDRLYESEDIIAHLRKHYGGGDSRIGRWLSRPGRVLGSSLASGSRVNHGMIKAESRVPGDMLELYSFESSPFSRLVRERLCELELAYIVRNTGKATWKDMGPPHWRKALFPDAPVTGRNRQALLKRAGKVQVPYLIDPNTGTELFESADILAYLDSQYCLEHPPTA